jgi:23S rRNA pseudouridine2604 synthase
MYASKRVAEERGCSRREAEMYIEGGFVSVDGKIVEEAGARVTPEQEVTIAEDATLLEIVPVTCCCTSRRARRSRSTC